jgi:hypothetical protein
MNSPDDTKEEIDCLYCHDEGTVKRRYGTAGPGPAKIVKRRRCPMCGDEQTQNTG